MDKLAPTIKIINGSNYDINDVLGCAECNNCGQRLELEIMGDHDCNSWTANCKCGYNTHLAGNPMVKASTYKD